MRVIAKSDDCVAGVRFVYHEYDYRPNWTTRSFITRQLIIESTISEKRRIAKLGKKGKIALKNRQRRRKHFKATAHPTEGRVVQSPIKLTQG